MVGLEMRGPSTVAGGVKGVLGWDEEWNVQDHSEGGAPGSSSQKVPAKVLAKEPTIIARSRRPAILIYRSYVIEHAYRLLRLPLYLLGWHAESEHIELSMMESMEFDKGKGNIPSSVKIELRSRHPLEVYKVSVHFTARLEGLRWLMYRYFLTSAIIGTSLFWGVEMGMLLFTWGIFTLLFTTSSSPLKHQKQKQIKQEQPSVKHEELQTQPGTPFSDTSRTFPTLSSHEPLHYASASPKSERHTPALEDVPMRDGGEVADDEDEEYVLQEPLPRGVERNGVFEDSGIGTSMESGMERERGLSRRRSGRLGGSGGDE